MQVPKSEIFQLFHGRINVRSASIGVELSRQISFGWHMLMGSPPHGSEPTRICPLSTLPSYVGSGMSCT